MIAKEEEKEQEATAGRTSRCRCTAPSSSAERGIILQRSPSENRRLAAQKRRPRLLREIVSRFSWWVFTKTMTTTRPSRRDRTRDERNIARA